MADAETALARASDHDTRSTEREGSRSRFSAVTRLGAWSLLGYLAYAWTIQYLPTRAIGLSRLAFPWYVDFLKQTNPIARLNPLADGRPFFATAFIVLLAYLTIGYFRVMHATRRRPVSGALRPILLWTVLFSVPLIMVPDIFSSDVYAYIMYGRISAIHGANPATIPPVAFPDDPLLANMRGWQEVAGASYGPVWLILSHGLTVLTDLWGQAPALYLLAYKLAAVGLHLANAALIWGILGRWRPERQTAGTLLYAWNPLALNEFAGSAHNDTLLIFFLLLGLWFAQEGRWRRAVVGLSLSALAKFVSALLLLPYAVFLARQQATWKRRAWIVGQAAGLSLLLVVLLCAPYWEGRRTVDALLEQPDMSGTVNTIGDWAVRLLPRVSEAISWQENAPSMVQSQGLAVGGPPGPPPPAGGPIFTLLVSRLGRTLLLPLQIMANPWSGKAILLVVWLGACFYLWRRPSFEHLVATSFWLLLTYILSGTMWFWPWYTMWPLALAALLDWRPAGRLMAVFTTLAWVLYFGWSHVGYLIVYVPVFALIAWCLMSKLKSGLAGIRRGSLSA